MLSNREKKFEVIFKEHYKELVHHSFKLLQDKEVCEEVVQQVFLKFWEKDWEHELNHHPKSYLYRAVYNESLNRIKQEQVRRRYAVFQFNKKHEASYELQQEKELSSQINLALQELPDKCRKVFEMSRYEDMKYKQIADTLDISIKTVEGHMSKALRHLRLSLTEYLTVLLITLTIWI